MPSHQCWPPISAVSGRPARTWRTNSRTDAWPAADPTTWAASARASQSAQSVGFDQSSGPKLRSSSANLRFSTAAMAIASGWSILGIVWICVVTLAVIVFSFSGCPSWRLDVGRDRRRTSR